MSQTINLPAPFQGVNRKIPTANLQSPFCENLLNFNVTPAGITLRKGDSKYTKFAAATGNTLRKLAPYGSTTLFSAIYIPAASRIEVYNVDTAALVYVTAASGDVSNTFYTLTFNKNLFFFADNYQYQFVYNGAAWAAMGYTYAGTFRPMGGGVFNHRSYLISHNEAAYFYSGIDEISGAVTKVDLSGVVSEITTLAIIAPITLANEQGATSLQAFVFFSGEVIFYSGTYPDSPTWGEVGRATIGFPLAYNSSVKYQGDTLVLCDNGVISLRDLFLQGSENAASLSVNSNIQPAWAELVRKMRVAESTPYGNLKNIHGIFDQANNRIIIQFPYKITTTGITQGSFYFIFNTILQSWFFHSNVFTFPDSVVDIAIFKNKVLLSNIASGDVFIWQKEGATDYQDVYSFDESKIGIEYEMLSAPVPFPKDAVYSICGVEPLLKSDLYAETNYNLVADFGRQTTDNQKTTAPTTAVQKPMVNVGIESNFVQLKISGTTAASKTVGLDLYSFNVLFNPGESGSR